MGFRGLGLGAQGQAPVRLNLEISLTVVFQMSSCDSTVMWFWREGAYPLAGVGVSVGRTHMAIRTRIPNAHIFGDVGLRVEG